MKDTIEKIKELNKKSVDLKTNAAKKTGKIDSEISKLKEKMEETTIFLTTEMDSIIKTKENLDKRQEEFVKNLQKEGMTVIDGKVEISNAPIMSDLEKICEVENITMKMLAAYLLSSSPPYEYYFKEEYKLAKEKGIELHHNEEIYKRTLDTIKDVYGEFKVIDTKEGSFDEGWYEELVTFSIGEIELEMENFIDGREGRNVDSYDSVDIKESVIKLY